jgi:hypothetical protein
MSGEAEQKGVTQWVGSDGGVPARRRSGNRFSWECAVE